MPSSVIRRFDYDPRAESLAVEFVNGRRYRYAGVPEDVAATFRAALSNGRFFNLHIRDAYPCRELATEGASDLWAL